MKIIFLLLLSIPLTALSQQNTPLLEDVIVTAQKREQSIQDIPISISVLDEKALSTMNIHGLGELKGIIPSLNIQPLGNAATTLTMAIRGHGPDPSQVTREGSVGVYIDGIYISRPQGMGVDLADPARVEILRGPQGTLFGRNTVGGAVSIISKKPTGQFGLTQTLDLGNYNAVRSLTHLNLPSFKGLSTKLDYIHDEFDGWVDNTSGQANFAERNNKGGRLSAHYDFNDDLSVDYAYDNTRTKTAQYYFQIHEDYTPAQSIGPEHRRQEQSRYPITLEPTTINKKGHSLTTTWLLSPHLTLTSITGYHQLKQDTQNNYGGVLYARGLIDQYKIDQKQLSQEIQLIGSSDQFEWVTGLYYFKEDAEQVFNTQISLDSSFNRIEPLTVDSFSGDIKAKSKAVFGQLTWTPKNADNIQLTIGGRYTDDNKKGRKIRNTPLEFDIGSHSIDPMIAVTYILTDNISAYAKWSSAYKAAGYNLRSNSFEPFDTETAETSEIGLKSELWEHKARLNLTVFSSVFKDMQLDFSDPVDITNPETKNAIDNVRVSGLEVDIVITPIESLTVSASYTYLGTDKHTQANPLDPTLSQTFHITQAPEHAGSLAIDYAISKNLSSHIDITSTDSYAHVSFEPLRLDAYTLVNARLSLDIPLQDNNLAISLWARNLLDEEYAINGFAVRVPADTVTQVFGDPRTYGMQLSFTF